MEALQRVDKLHKTATGYLVVGLVGLGLAYLCALWAIDNGNVWLYVVTVVLFIGAVHDMVRLPRKVLHYVKAR